MSDIIRQVLLPKLEGVRMQGGYWMAKCPAHDDGQASLSISPGRDQPILLNCHAGCDTDDILAKIGLTWAELCNPPDASHGLASGRGAWTPWGDALAVYDYRDEGGDLLFQVLRGPGKRFIQRRPDASAKQGWAYTLGDTRRVLYRLPEVIAAVADCALIHVTEGEKDADRLWSMGIAATCNPHGAGKWRDEFCDYLRDACVVIIADRDDPGYAHARMVAASLADIAAAVEIVEAAVGKDASDHFDAGKTLADLVRIWQEGDPPADLAPDLIEFLMVEDPPQTHVIGDELLALADRMILTGPEGFGKTTFCRQIGLCCALGRHPFDGRVCTPRRVLQIDCENRERQSRLEFRWLYDHAVSQGWVLGEGMYRLMHRPLGIDLGSEDGRAWLVERVTAHEPDLLIIGSLWKLHRGDLNDELAARVVTEALDAAVNQAGCALLVEAHSPHGEGPRRPVRPAGSSVFLRWPEVGLGLQPAKKENPQDPTRFTLHRWRGGRDRTQPWPRTLLPGISGGWPWIAEPDQSEFGRS